MANNKKFGSGDRMDKESAEIKTTVFLRSGWRLWRRLVGVENSLRKRKLSPRERVGSFCHDFVAHPLIGLTGGASWAWALHDVVGEVATTGTIDEVLRVMGPSSLVDAALDCLQDNGFDVKGSHTHGDDGRAWGVVDAEKARALDAEATASDRKCDCRRCRYQAEADREPMTDCKYERARVTNEEPTP